MINPYDEVISDLVLMEQNDKIRHSKTLEFDARKDLLYSIYQRTLQVAVELRTELSRRERV
jgi:hypothetical protein